MKPTKLVITLVIVLAAITVRIGYLHTKMAPLKLAHGPSVDIWDRSFARLMAPDGRTVAVRIEDLFERSVLTDADAFKRKCVGNSIVLQAGETAFWAVPVRYVSGLPTHVTVAAGSRTVGMSYGAYLRYLSLGGIIDEHILSITKSSYYRDYWANIASHLIPFVEFSSWRPILDPDELSG